MSQKLTESFPFKIANGQTGGNIQFQPQAGKVIGFSIYHNNDAGNVNTGIVNAKIKVDGGDEIAPLCDIRHYRNRNAAYRDGLVELDHETGSRFHILTIASDTAFTADFKGTVVFAYEKQYC